MTLMQYKPKKSLELKPEYRFARAKKALGQNFLKSEPALRRILEAGEIKKGDVILEIGPGKGKLTEKLLEKISPAVAGQGLVIAVEKDRELFEFLKEKFAKKIEKRSLVLVHGDILDFQVESYKVKSYKVIANIPYNITGAILKKFLTAEHQPTSMVLMVQHEVAKRILGREGKAKPLKIKPSGVARSAKSGFRESLLSISVKAYGEPKMVMKVPARYFSPSPKVDSAVISIKNISRKFFTQNDINEDRFWEILRMGFAHKRKKLFGNLKSLKSGNFDSKKELIGNKRAEDLTLSDWVELAK